ncbi:unnamed protein product [Adineta steineri]|uniref:NADP-dependent oxidoreductase domain-containing protein n=1 Tax=Adineta steineri TaxID=433720 RepID=A0A815GAY6_9BILA|nr:unnamed protein product [Adineta steineri]CAF1336033.1 unnamed protein product [Adineta steineri]CAF1419599.1 unnamed protein product [Adineta steineri]CAF1620331.1 unnamed protein product [Adineta steineri]
MFSLRIILLGLFISTFYLSSDAKKHTRTSGKTLHSQEPVVQLKNAVHGKVFMPVMGLGTKGAGLLDGTGGEYWGNEQGHNATLAWLKAGGRRIDSSSDYITQDGVATGWIASGVPRSKIFITSKIMSIGYDEALKTFDDILASLKTDYIDLLLIHWPGDKPGTVTKPVPACKKDKSTWTDCRVQTWKALEHLFKQKKVHAIGVSNFGVNHLLEIFNLNSLIPSVNQVEFHPYWHEDELLDFCQKNNITFNSYAPLASADHATFLGTSWNPIPDLRQHPDVIRIAEKYHKSSVQILLRWQWQQGIVMNPRTLNPAHMIENLSIFDFKLSKQDMMILSYINHPMSKMFPDPRLIL